MANLFVSNVFVFITKLQYFSTCVLSYDSLSESKDDGNFDLLQMAFWQTVVRASTNPRANKIRLPMSFDLVQKDPSIGIITKEYQKRLAVVTLIKDCYKI
jgi:hypothetical protein